MGLDMYLHKRTHVYHYINTPITDPQASVTYPGVRSERVSDITERMGVWRKANAIHQWFVDNCQGGEDDCMEHYVDTDDLKKLADAVDQVIADHSLASELLPTQGGFFFGDTDYGEYYFQDLELTKEICKTALADAEGGDFYYEASW